MKLVNTCPACDATPHLSAVHAGGGSEERPVEVVETAVDGAAGGEAGLLAPVDAVRQRQQSAVAAAHHAERVRDRLAWGNTERATGVRNGANVTERSYVKNKGNLESPECIARRECDDFTGYLRKTVVSS